MQGARQAEYEYVVTGLEHGVTGDQHPFVVAYETGKSHVVRQPEVFYRGTCNLGTFVNFKFGDFGIGKCQTFGSGGVCIKKQLEDSTRCEQFLVYYSAYIEIFCLGYELYVLDIGHSLLYAHFLRRQAGEYVGFGAVRECHEGIHIVDADIGEEIGVAGVSVYDFAIGAFLRQFPADLEVVFHDFEFEPVAGKIYKSYRYFRSPHDQHTLDLVLGFAGEHKQIIDMVAGRGEVEYVAAFHLIVAARYYGFVVPFDGRHVEVTVCKSEILELHSRDGCALPQFDSGENYRAVMQFKPVAYPRSAERGYDFFGCYVFRIDHMVDTDMTHMLGVGRIHEVVRRDTCHGGLGTEIFCYGACHYVVRFIGRDCDEQVA